MLMPFAKVYSFVLAVLILLLVGCSANAPKPVVVDTKASSTTAVAPINADLQQRFLDALVLLRDEEFVEAETAFNDLTTEYPGYPGPWSNLAIAQNKQEKYEQALTSLDKALEIDQDFCQALSLKGVNSRELGQFQQAKEYYQAAIKCNPADNLSIYNLGVLADMYLQDEATALAYYQEYLSRLGDESDDTVSSWVVDLKRRVPAESVTDISAILNAGIKAVPASSSPAGIQVDSAQDDSADIKTAAPDDNAPASDEVK